MLNAGYKGRLNSGDYQFSLLGNIINKEKSIGFLIPHSGYIKSIVLETPFDFSKQQNYDKNMEYVALRIPLFKVVIEKKNPKEEVVAKTIYCEFHYDKIHGNVREVDPSIDILRRVVVYDYGYDANKAVWLCRFAGGDYFKGGDVLNIKTVMPYPKIYEFLKEDNIYHFSFLLKLDSLF